MSEEVVSQKYFSYASLSTCLTYQILSLLMLIFILYNILVFDDGQYEHQVKKVLVHSQYPWTIEYLTSMILASKFRSCLNILGIYQTPCVPIQLWPSVHCLGLHILKSHVFCVCVCVYSVGSVSTSNNTSSTTGVAGGGGANAGVVLSVGSGTPISPPVPPVVPGVKRRASEEASGAPVTKKFVLA